MNPPTARIGVRVRSVLGAISLPLAIGLLLVSLLLVAARVAFPLLASDREQLGAAPALGIADPRVGQDPLPFQVGDDGGDDGTGEAQVGLQVGTGEGADLAHGGEDAGRARAQGARRQ